MFSAFIEMYDRLYTRLFKYSLQKGECGLKKLRVCQTKQELLHVLHTFLCEDTPKRESVNRLINFYFIYFILLFYHTQ